MASFWSILDETRIAVDSEFSSNTSTYRFSYLLFNNLIWECRWNTIRSFGVYVFVMLPSLCFPFAVDRLYKVQL